MWFDSTKKKGMHNIGSIPIIYNLYEGSSVGRAADV